MVRRICALIVTVFLAATAAFGALVSTATAQSQPGVYKLSARVVETEGFVARYAFFGKAVVNVDFRTTRTANGTLITGVRVPKKTVYKTVEDVQRLQLLVSNSIDGPVRLSFTDDQINLGKKWKSTGHIFCYGTCNVTVAGAVDIKKWRIDGSFGGVKSVG